MSPGAARIAVAALLLCGASVPPGSARATDATPRPGPTERLGDALREGERSVAFRPAVVELGRESGFDVDRGESDGTVASPAFALRLTLPGDGFGERRWSLDYDRVDFDGLELRTLAAGWQLLGRTGGGRGLHAGVGVGGSLGLTRSDSFFDSALHGVGEINATALLGLGWFALEYDVFARLTTGATLDERTAAPRTLGARVTFAVRF